MGLYHGQNNIINPDIFYYNWWAISNPNFPPSGWVSLSVSTAPYFEQYCDYYGATDLVNRFSQYCRHQSGSASLISGGNNLFFWLTNNYSSFGRYFWYLINTGYYRETQDYNNPKTGYPVVLMKYSITNPGTLIDYDGNVYNTIQIGNYIFTVEPWRCKHLNDGTEITYAASSSMWTNLNSMGMSGFNMTYKCFC